MMEQGAAVMRQTLDRVSEEKKAGALRAK